MMRTLLIAACLVAIAATAMAETVTLTVTNPLDETRPGAICVGPASLLGDDVRPGAYTAASSNGQMVALQVDDLDADGRADEFATVLDLRPLQTASLWVDLAKPWSGRDGADVRLSWRYEGYAALETDRMAAGLYGIYAPTGFTPSLQWDVYGKRPNAWRLSLDELESVNYHADNPVAVDYLLVANSMGLGGPTIGSGRPVAITNGDYTYRVLCNGPVRAGLEVRVTDWGTPAGGLYDATIGYVVYAGHDFIDATFALTEREASDEDFGLGVRRISHVEAFVGDEEAGVLGVMGRQDGIVAKTGLAVLFEPQRFLRWGVEDEPTDAYMIYLSPDAEGGAEIYRARLLGIWSEGGVANEHTMPRHLLDLAARMNQPVEVGR